MNNWWLFFLLFPIYLFAQNHYLKPVYFFEHSFTSKNSAIFLNINPNDCKNLIFFKETNDSVTSFNSSLLLDSTTRLFNVIIVDSITRQTVGYKTIFFHPFFIFLDNNQIYQSYLLKDVQYETPNKFDEIKLFRSKFFSPLPPHLFYKKKQELEWIGQLDELEFSKVQSRDILFIKSQNDSFLIPVFGKNYPDLTLRDSIEAMVYLLTRSEYRFLKKVNKKSYLSFVWNGFDEESQMGLKELYFRRVYEANLYFPETKEGWRTEKGMIYIIFGKPSVIVIYEGYEDWFYERTQLNDRPVYFRFKVLNKKYGQIEYVLERKPEYYEYWNDAIDAWRHGLILKEK